MIKQFFLSIICWISRGHDPNKIPTNNPQFSGQECGFCGKILYVQGGALQRPQWIPPPPPNPRDYYSDVGYKVACEAWKQNLQTESYKNDLRSQ